MRMFKRFRSRDRGTPPPTQRHTSGRVVYAVGDIHGRRDLFERLLAQIAADAGEVPAAERPLLVLLGDYVDRGPDSRGVIDAVLTEVLGDRFEVRALMGNHEQAMLRFLADPISGAAWLHHGADATLRSYGVAVPAGALDVDALVRVRDDLRGRPRRASRLSGRPGDVPDPGNLWLRARGRAAGR